MLFICQSENEFLAETENEKEKIQPHSKLRSFQFQFLAPEAHEIGAIFFLFAVDSGTTQSPLASHFLMIVFDWSKKCLQRILTFCHFGSTGVSASESTLGVTP